MSDELQSSPEGITYTDNLPIQWEVLQELPSEGEQHRHNLANEELLQNMLLRDEASQESDEIEVGSGQEHFRRLETKLDLLLSLVTEMMTQNGSVPPKYALNLGTHGLSVFTQKKGMANLEVGALLRIRLYLDSQIPRPLDICGHLTAKQADSFTVSYCPLEPRVQDLLDKMVFRCHRRVIASSRRDTE